MWEAALGRIKNAKNEAELNVIRGKVKRGLALLNKSCFKPLSAEEEEEMQKIDIFMESKE